MAQNANNAAKIVEFEEDTESSIGRRSSERVSLVYRPVLLEADGFAGFCLVRNLSPDGMMGSVYTQFAEGQQITVQFHPDRVIKASIAWSQDGNVGIKFDEEIDVAELLRMLADKQTGAMVNRAPRLHIECNGVLELDGRAIPIRLRDISQRGVKVQASFIRPGDQVVVRLPGLDPHKSLVRWTQDGFAGLNFVCPLAFEDLAIWAIARQSH